MSDLATLLDTILPSQAQKEASANAIFNALSLASVFARRDGTSASLTWGYYGGRVNGTLYANGSVVATASNTNYVVVHRTTYVVSIATTTTNWNNTATYGRAYLLTAGASTITDYQDHRFSNDGTGIFNLGGGSVGTALTDVKDSVRAATTANITLSGAQTIDGVSVIAGDRVLVKNQSTASQNGIYDCASGAWARSADSDTSAEVTGGMFVFVNEGTVNGDTGWILTTNDPITLASTSLTFAQFSTFLADDSVTNAKLNNMANATIKGRTTAGTGDPEDLTAAQAAAILGTNVKSIESMIVACTDEATSITAATGKVTFRMPYAFTLTDVRASLTTAQTSGSIFTVNIKESGTTIFSTKITLDNTEKTSQTAATPRVISDSSLADDAEMTVDVDQIGDGTAKGLKIYLIGTRT